MRALAAVAGVLFACAPGSQVRTDASPPEKNTAPALRVCADPNNLPFSNERGEGFENELAQLLAADLGKRVEYTWLPQRRGFIRNTLNAEKCDVVMGVPAGYELVATTAPYYRSTYVFVYGAAAPRVRTLDAPELRQLTIGVPVVGDDGASTPPVDALGRRGIIDNLRGYSIFGDYSKESPPSELVRAVARGDVDLAVAWGPLAGYYAKRQSPPLEIAPIPPEDAPPGVPFQFDISLGVRKKDAVLRAELDAALVRNREQIAALLERFGIPVVDGAAR